MTHVSYECSKIGVENLNETTQKSITERLNMGWKKANNHTENLRLRDAATREVHQKQNAHAVTLNINIVVAHYYYYYYYYYYFYPTDGLGLDQSGLSSGLLTFSGH
jgi:hypothetical protein